MSHTATKPTILLQYWELHQEYQTSFLESIFSLTLVVLLFMLVLLTLIIRVVISFKNTSHTKTLNLPPSPSKLPIIGHLHQLGPLPHHTLQSLAQKHGPNLMMIHLGLSPTLVVSSPQAAKEIIKTHDLIFSSRPDQTIVKRLLYDHKDLAFTPYGEHWRQIRRICVLQLFSTNRVQSFKSVREEEVKLMIQKIIHHSSTSCNNSLPPPAVAGVNLSELLLALTNDIICRVAFGKRYSGGDEQVIGERFGEKMIEIMYLMGVFNVGDFIPWLGWINHFNGLNVRVEKCFREMDCFLEGVVEEHIVNKKMREASKGDEEDYKEDLVDVLLGINDKNSSTGLIGGSLGRDSIKAIILDMFAAGTDTSHSVLEWAMAELIRHPQVMKQVQEEVREIAKGKVDVTEEDDLNKMHYLQAIIKETLRLHPPAPLLLPRESTEDSKIQGYNIPAKTRVLINAYAIGRDPESWKEPNKFEPERFMSSSVDYKGHDFEFIPFGAGRRGCPGIAFAAATIELALANLLFRFDWKLPAADPNGTDIDMAETSGIVVHMKSPLLLIATDRSITTVVTT